MARAAPSSAAPGSGWRRGGSEMWIGGTADSRAERPASLAARGLEEVLQLFQQPRLVQLVERLDLQLADALARDAHLRADLVQRLGRRAAQAEAQRQDAALLLGQRFAHDLVEAPAEGHALAGRHLLLALLRRQDGRDAAALVAERRVEGEPGAVRLHQPRGGLGRGFELPA